MIIDKTKPEFDDVPATLEGEVLLGRHPLGGFFTATVDVVRSWKGKSHADKVRGGWDRYQDILDNLPENAEQIVAEILARKRGQKNGG